MTGETKITQNITQEMKRFTLAFLVRLCLCCVFIETSRQNE
jgi:hypothetical protein